MAKSFTHIVLFKLEDDSAQAREAVRDRLMGLEGAIPGLQQIEVGIDTLRTQRSYDVSLLTRFDSQRAMEAYQAHPAHQEVATYMRGVLQQAASVDYAQ